ncbi:MAG: hypothetical protein V4722_00175 [Bacteroidota bacterium]
MKKISLTSTVLFSMVTWASAQNVGIGTTNPTNKLEVISTVVSASNATIGATNNGTVGSAIYGISNAAGTYGVQGTSNNGIGVFGSSSYIALAANATSGTAAYGTSVSGYGLRTIGKIRLAGGNTNPVDGAVLTSDATGNAVWKPRKNGFFVSGAANSAIPPNIYRKVEFGYETYDPGSDFVNFQGTTTSSTSVFTAPVAGVYHFSSAVMFENTDEASMQYADIRIIKNSTAIALKGVKPVYFTGPANAFLEIEGDFHLDANDKIWIEVSQHNSLGKTCGLNNENYTGRFSGQLKFAD